MNNIRNEIDSLRSRCQLLQVKNLLVRILTLGIVNYNKELEALRGKYQEILKLEKEYAFQSGANNILDEQIKHQDLMLCGVRVGTNTFSDVPVEGRLTYPADWDTLRELILVRDNYLCQEEDANCDGALHIHHILELTRGGSNDPDNLITLCEYHHSQKHDHMKNREHHGNIWR